MESIFDPSRNMARYRSVVKAAVPPLVPLFPLIMKDLTFFHEGMKCRENGLVKFEKLRLLAREIRQAKAYCNKVIEVRLDGVVCVCVRACVRACVCTCVCGALHWSLPRPPLHPAPASQPSIVRHDQCSQTPTLHRPSQRGKTNSESEFGQAPQSGVIGGEGRERGRKGGDVPCPPDMNSPLCLPPCPIYAPLS